MGGSEGSDAQEENEEEGGSEGRRGGIGVRWPDEGDVTYQAGREIYILFDDLRVVICSLVSNESDLKFRRDEQRDVQEKIAICSLVSMSWIFQFWQDERCERGEEDEGVCFRRYGSYEELGRRIARI